MPRCEKCGQPIEFRYLDGVCTPIHIHGHCEASGRNRAAELRRSSTWTQRECCWPTRCPKCRARVYFVRHNDGSVWLDELGWPWPKHGCFDEPTQSSLDWVLDRTAGGSAETDRRPFGLIVRASRFVDGAYRAKLIAVSMSNATGMCLNVPLDSALDCGVVVLLREDPPRTFWLVDCKGAESQAKLVRPATLDLTNEFLRTGRL